jgi:hypothetical protein
MSKETLEEAMDKNGYHDEVNDTMWREGVKFGAKWQEERSYSEEDLKQAMITVIVSDSIKNSQDITQYIERLKKK